MPKIAALTDLGLRSLPLPVSGQLDYWDASFKHGLFGCRVSQGGSKAFIVKNRNRRYTIGRYPSISLQEARGEAKKLLAEITLGRARPHAVTYAQAVDEFLEEKGKNRRSRTVRDYKESDARGSWRQ